MSSPSVAASGALPVSSSVCLTRVRQLWKRERRSSRSTGGTIRGLGGDDGCAQTRVRTGGAGGGAGTGKNSRRTSSKIGSALIVVAWIVFYPTLARRHKKRFKTESIEPITTINHEASVNKENSDRAEARPEPAGPLRGFGGHSPAKRQHAATKPVPGSALIFPPRRPGARVCGMLYIADNARHPLRPYPRTRRR